MVFAKSNKNVSVCSEEGISIILAEKGAVKSEGISAYEEEHFVFSLRQLPLKMGA